VRLGRGVAITKLNRQCLRPGLLELGFADHACVTEFGQPSELIGSAADADAIALWIKCPSNRTAIVWPLFRRFGGCIVIHRLSSGPPAITVREPGELKRDGLPAAIDPA
jgi:hypothetical protein